MSTKAQTLARLHLETAVELVGMAVVQEWVQAQGSATITATEQKKETRGRKPGAAPTEIRCVWTNADIQCKNTRQSGSTYCRIHVGKAAAITAAVGDAELPPL